MGSNPHFNFGLWVNGLFDCPCETPGRIGVSPDLNFRPDPGDFLYWLLLPGVIPGRIGVRPDLFFMPVPGDFVGRTGVSPDLLGVLF